VKELNSLPLAIEHAGILVGKNIVPLSIFVTEYRTRYSELMNEPLTRGLLSYNRHNEKRKIMIIFNVFEMLYDFIKKENCWAATLLDFIIILGS
jgi:hypothetical protein